MCFLLSHASQMAFPGGSDSEESTCSAGDPASTLGQEDPLEKGMATVTEWAMTDWVTDTHASKYREAWLFC